MNEKLLELLNELEELSNYIAYDALGKDKKKLRKKLHKLIKHVEKGETEKYIEEVHNGFQFNVK